ncbi:hypothetical protein GCM10027568_27980 [Humibacter soli]
MMTAVVYAVAGLVVFGGLAAIAQGSTLAAAMKVQGWLAVLAFVAGGCTVLLPRRLPLIAMIVLFFLFAYIGTLSMFVPLFLMLLVLGGFFTGIGVYSIVFQLRGKGRPPLLRTGR